MSLFNNGASGLDFRTIFNLAIWCPPVVVTQFTTNTNDLALPAGSVIHISADAPRDLTGIVAPTEARQILLINTGSAAITLRNQSGSSTAANRLLSGTGGNVVLQQNQFAFLCYDPTTSTRWRLSGGLTIGDGLSVIAGVLGLNTDATLEIITGALSVSGEMGAKVFADFLADIVTDSNAAITLGTAHNGRTLYCTHATPVVTIPSTIAKGFSCLITGDNAIGIVQGSGATVISSGLTIPADGIATAICIKAIGTVHVKGELTT